jgi:hypothetical protein
VRHLAQGDAIADRVRPAIGGPWLVWREDLSIGALPSDATPARLAIRATQLGGRGEAPAIAAALAAQERALAELAAAGEPVALWLGNDLVCALQELDWLARLAGVEAILRVAPPVDHPGCLLEEDPAALRAALAAATPIASAERADARTARDAVLAPDARALDAALAQVAAARPARALRLHRDRLPSRARGLDRLEALVLDAVVAGTPPLGAAGACPELGATDRAVGLALDRLAAATPGLLEPGAGLDGRRATPHGRAVAVGGAGATPAPRPVGGALGGPGGYGLDDRGAVVPW